MRFTIILLAPFLGGSALAAAVPSGLNVPTGEPINDATADTFTARADSCGLLTDESGPGGNGIPMLKRVGGRATNVKIKSVNVLKGCTCLFHLQDASLPSFTTILASIPCEALELIEPDSCSSGITTVQDGQWVMQSVRSMEIWRMLLCLF
ncbi:hypothetical protein K469DRAFT_683230 [Zopfia rhizophila CBS 207.26]|uniref:Uncharacterized protein n=1 Tax=Zopfia rhizophila CBS 207.26 TaxID=1314779 RepID=A0A6A6EG85_9PEZI|nr:hypothetical protein K469DRAFT_683230 [Zopfia rhizophila CBS 207.26]